MIAYVFLVILGSIIVCVLVLKKIKRQMYQPIATSDYLFESTDMKEKYEQYSLLQKYWFRHGVFVARHPIIIVLVCLVFAGVCSVGMMKFDTENDPEKLWTPPDAISAQNEEYFNENFGQFFRIEQLIITAENEGDPVLTLPILEQVLEIQKMIQAIQVTVNGTEITMDDLCFKPIPGEGCLILSVTEYWQNNMTNLMATQDIAGYLDSCTGTTIIPSCMSEIGVPMDPFVVFGGFDPIQKNYLNSTATIVTILLNDLPNTTEYALAWELEFLKIASAHYNPIKIYYSADVRKDEPDLLIFKSIFYLCRDLSKMHLLLKL